jgi:hypothetical protein
MALLGTFTVYALSRLNNQAESSLFTKKSVDEQQTRRGVLVDPGQRKDRAVVYRGVSFTCNDFLASEIKAETEAAYALESETDTGQGVVPEHIVFKFLGDYASQHRSSTFSPELNVYPIADYKKVLVRSESYVRQFETKIQALKQMLSEQPNRGEKEIPFLPFGIGASQGFHARMKYVNFRNGKGVLFLTQYNIEPALVNNQGLTYTFQGLTDDGDYYVSATFPVTAPILPHGYEAESTESYTLVPPRASRGREYDSFENDYRTYLTKLTLELEELSADKYQPNLTILEDVIRSLNVERP